MSNAKKAPPPRSTQCKGCDSHRGWFSGDYGKTWYCIKCHGIRYPNARWQIQRKGKKD